MNQNAIMRISDNNPQFTTLIANSVRDKVTLYNAVQNPTEKVSDYINKRFQFVNVYMEKAQYVDEEGVVTNGVKTILIAPDGHGILANSQGIANSLYQIFQIFGLPEEWDELGGVMTCEVKQIETTKGRYFKLEVIID